jgi:hypothetical protein
VDRPAQGEVVCQVFLRTVITNEDKLRFIGWFWLVWAIPMLYGEGRHYFRDAPSLSWPSTQGIITHSEAGEPKGRGGCKHLFTYAYEVGNRSYTGTRKTWYDHNYSPDYIGNVISNFPMGMQITVFYDKSNPASSVLSPKLNDEQQVLHYIALIYLLTCPIVALTCFGTGKWSLALRRIVECMIQKSS